MALQPQPQAFCSPRSSAQEPAGRGVAAEMEGKGSRHRSACTFCRFLAQERRVCKFQLQALFTNLLISAYQMAADGASADVAADAADVARLVFTTLPWDGGEAFATPRPYFERLSRDAARLDIAWPKDLPVQLRKSLKDSLKKKPSSWPWQHQGYPRLRFKHLAITAWAAPRGADVSRCAAKGAERSLCR
ncbi:unnamed protein product [Cladocopium goreaui]|uniref:Uncharacterized protein n=1 Tax=Cladocopium goreaui TaxID=2562237 RepID=A0A9P1BM91_9DINO|nr:unnamed protein product [Cladocopium goreaui]